MKKRVFFFLCLILFALGLITGPKIFDSSIKFFLKRSFKEVDFEDVIFNRGLIFKNLKISSESYNFFAKKCFLKIKLRAFPFKIKKELKVFKPKIFLIKRKEEYDQNNKIFFFNDVKIKEGHIFFNENGEEKSLDFDFKRKKDFFLLNIFEKRILKTKIIKNGFNVDIDFLGIDLKKTNFLSLLSKFEKIDYFENIDFFGKVFGKCSFQLVKDYKKLNYSFLNADLKFLDFYLENKKLQKSFLSKKVLLKLNSLEKKSFLKNCKIVLKAEDGKVFLEKQNRLEKVFLDFYYHPKCGPKIDFKSVAILEDKKRDVFNIFSRGFLKKKEGNWLDLDIFFSEKNKVFLKLLKKDKDLFLLKTKLEAKKEFLNFLKSCSKFYFKENCNVAIKDGNLFMDFEIAFHKNRIYSVDVENFCLQNLDFLIEKNKFFLKKIEGNFSFEKENFFKSFTSKIEIKDGVVSYNHLFNILDINGNLFIKNGKIINNSFAKCFFNGLNTEIFFQNDLLNTKIEAVLSGRLEKNDICFFPFPLSAKIYLEKKEKKYKLHGFLNGLNNKNVESFAFGGFLSQKDHFFWIRAENIFLGRFKKFLPCEIEGRVDFSGAIKNNKLFLNIDSKDLYYSDKFVDVNFTKTHISLEKNIFLKEDWMVAIKDAKGFFYVKNLNTKFFFEKSKAFLNHKFLKCNFFKITNNSLCLRSDLFLDFKNPKMDIFIKQGKGEIEDLKNIFLNYDFFNLKDLKGKFFIKQKGVFFSKVFKENEKPIFQANASVMNGSFSFYKDIFVKDINADFNFLDFNDFNAEKLNGKILIKNMDFDFSFLKFLKKKNVLHWDLRLKKGFLEVLALLAKTEFNEEEIKFIFNKNCHFLNEKLNIYKCFLHKNFGLKSLKLKPDFDLSKFCFLKKSGEKILGKIKTDIFLQDKKIFIKAKGKDLFFKRDFKTLFFDANIDENKVLTVTNLKLDDFFAKFLFFKEKNIFKVSNFFLSRKKSKILSEIKIKNFSKVDIDIKNIKIDLDEKKGFLNEEMGFSIFKAKKEIEGKGWVCFFLDKENSLEADFDLHKLNFLYKDLFLQNKKGVNLHYSYKDGLNIKGLDVNFFSKKKDLSNMQVRVKYLNFYPSEKKWFLNEASFFIPKDFITFFEKRLFAISKFFLFAKKMQFFEKDLDFSADIEFFLEKGFLKGFLKEFFWKDKKIKNLNIQMTKSKVLFDFDYLNMKDIYGEIESIKDFSGKICFGKKNKNPLTMYYILSNDGIKVDRILGSSFGISANLFLENEKKDLFSLFGSVTFDFNETLKFFKKEDSLFKKELLALKNIELRGVFTFLKNPICFHMLEADIVGKDFEIKDFLINTLLGKIKATRDKIEIKDLKISDKAGILSIKDIFITLKNNERWFFSIAEIKAFEFRPSLLRNKEEKKQIIKPLLIRNFELFNFSGFLDDFSSFKGKGHFNFINSFKREHNLFELPADFLGRILGLDLELLIPVQGKIFYEIVDGKFLVTKAQNLFSENKRSKFFLSGDCYMDFFGNLNIDLKMKQYVLFKVTGKFILSVTGNIKKPKFNLKKKKS